MAYLFLIAGKSPNPRCSRVQIGRVTKRSCVLGRKKLFEKWHRPFSQPLA